MGQFRSALCDAIRVPGGSAVCPHFSPGRYAYDEIQAVFEHLRDFPQAFSGTDCAIVTPPSSVCAWGSVGGKRGGGIPSPPGPPCRAPGMAPLPGGTNAAAPGRRGDFPVPPLSGCAWGSVAGKRGGGIPSPPGHPFRAPGKAPPPRRQEWRRSFAPGMAMLRAGGGTFLSPFFLVALGVPLPGSAEGGLRPPQVLPLVGRLERRPLPGGTNAAAPSRLEWRCSGQEGGLSCPPSFWLCLGFGWREAWRGDSVAPRYSLSGAWKGAPPRRHECRRSAPGMATLRAGGGTFLSPLFLLALGLRLAGSVEGGIPSPLGTPCRAPGKAPLPGGRNAVAPSCLEWRRSSAARMPPLLGVPRRSSALPGGVEGYSAVAKTVTVAPRPRAASVAARGWARRSSPK